MISSTFFNIDFYQAVHEECIERFSQFDREEKELLTAAFTKAKDYLPQESPFISPSLY